METGRIFKIKRFSVHDGPGIRTTVFLKGCPLRCTWCHSPEGQDERFEIWQESNTCIACGLCVEACTEKAVTLQTVSHKITVDRNLCRLNGNCVSVCPTTAMQFTGKEMSVEQVFAEIEKDITFYESSGGGVTFTGGEPLYQDSFVAAIAEKCRNKGIHTAVETCLSGNIEVMEILNTIDLFIIDLKIFDASEHLFLTGRSNEEILENFRMIVNSGKEIIVRIPLVKNITDTPENLNSIRNFVHSLNPSIPVELIPFNPLAGNNYERLGIPFRLNEL